MVVFNLTRFARVGPDEPPESSPHFAGDWGLLNNRLYAGILDVPQYGVRAGRGDFE
ncbi:MAG: hypothetical protein H0W53_11945 [Acidobacteria bacterium]|nr:hypothetical protein [Acidobacteriota bacterium]